MPQIKQKTKTCAHYQTILGYDNVIGSKQIHGKLAYDDGEVSVEFSLSILEAME